MKNHLFLILAIYIFLTQIQFQRESYMGIEAPLHYHHFGGLHSKNVMKELM